MCIVSLRLDVTRAIYYVYVSHMDGSDNTKLLLGPLYMYMYTNTNTYSNTASIHMSHTPASSNSNSALIPNSFLTFPLGVVSLYVGI